MKRTFVSLVLIYAILLVSVVSPVAAQFGDRSTEPYCGGGYRTDSFYLDSRGLHGAQYVYSTDDQHAGGRLFEQFVTLQDEGWVEGVGYIPTYFVTGGYYQYYDNSPLRYVSWRLGTSYIYYSTHANPTQDDYQVYNILLINDAWWVWCGQWLLRTVDNGYEECNVSCEVSKRHLMATATEVSRI